MKTPGPPPGIGESWRSSLCLRPIAIDFDPDGRSGSSNAVSVRPRATPREASTNVVVLEDRNARRWTSGPLPRRVWSARALKGAISSSSCGPRTVAEKIRMATEGDRRTRQRHHGRPPRRSKQREHPDWGSTVYLHLRPTGTCARDGSSRSCRRSPGQWARRWTTLDASTKLTRTAVRRVVAARYYARTRTSRGRAVFRAAESREQSVLADSRPWREPRTAISFHADDTSVTFRVGTPSSTLGSPQKSCTATRSSRTRPRISCIATDRDRRRHVRAVDGNSKGESSPPGRAIPPRHALAPDGTLYVRHVPWMCGAVRTYFLRDLHRARTCISGQSGTPLSYRATTTKPERNRHCRRLRGVLVQTLTHPNGCGEHAQRMWSAAKSAAVV